VTTVGGDRDDAVACLDPADGSLRWERTLDSPVTWAAGVAVDPPDGSSTAAGGRADGAAAGTVVVADLRDGIVVLDGREGGTRWAVRDRDLTPPVVAPTGIGIVVAGDRDRDRLVARAAESGERRWSVPGGDVRRLLAVDGRVYAADWTGTVRALASTDGRVRWTVDAGAPAVTLTPVEDLLCLRTGDGRGHAVECDGGRVRWSIGPDRPTAVVSRAGDALLAVGPEGGIDLLAPATGEPVWRSGASSHAVAPDGRDLYLAGDRAVEAISIAGDPSGSTVW
jgi:outer membrane protein assembly factor BamB